MALAFWNTGPGRGEISAAHRNTEVERAPGSVVVKSLYSGISRGTESLVAAGRVPDSEQTNMRAPFQEGDFPFPVKYGYCNVGRVIDGPSDWCGRSVFCLFPHQDVYSVPIDAVTLIPDSVPEKRAVLAANMETAVNGVWDANPSIGDRVAVVGLGVVGLLIAHLIQNIPGTQVLAFDTNPDREKACEALGLSFCSALPDKDFDLVIHASGNPAGMAAALELCGLEAKLIEMSWFGDSPVSLPLGRKFHSHRLTIRSSQVGRLNPERAVRWNYGDRMALALNLLADPIYEHLISGESHFEDLPRVIAGLSGFAEDQSAPCPSGTLCHRIFYPQN